MKKEPNITENQSQDLPPERHEASIALANDFLSRATLAEALSQVSLTAILQLTQAQAFQQGKEQVENMSDDEVSKLLQALKAKKESAESAAQNAVKDVTTGTEKVSQ